LNKIGLKKVLFESSKLSNMKHHAQFVNSQFIFSISFLQTLPKPIPGYSSSNSNPFLKLNPLKKDNIPHPPWQNVKDENRKDSRKEETRPPMKWKGDARFDGNSLGRKNFQIEKISPIVHVIR